MSFPSTPDRAQRLEMVFSPRTANMVVSTRARTAPPPELLEQYVEEPPYSLELEHNTMMARMAHDKAAHDHAIERAGARESDKYAASDEKEKIAREYRRARVDLERKHKQELAERDQKFLDDTDACEAKLNDAEKYIQEQETFKDAKAKSYEEDRKLMNTVLYLLSDAPKEYSTKKLAVIREERSLQHQGKLPDNKELLYKILFRLYNLGLPMNPEFRGAHADETTGFKGCLLTGPGSKAELKARIIQYLQIPPDPSGEALSEGCADAQLVVAPPSHAVDRATQQAQLAAQIAMLQAETQHLQAQLTAVTMDAPAAHHNEPPPPPPHQHQHPAVHRPAGDEEYGSHPSAKRQRLDNL